MEFPIPSFIKRLFSKQAKKGYEGAGWTTLYPSSVIEKNLLENNKEWVFIAVDRVAKAVAAVRFKVMRYQRSGDDQEVFDGPLVEFLESPGTNFTGKDFIYLDTAYKELTGNAFWKVEKKQRLFPLIPTQIEPKVTGGRITGFSYTEDGTKKDLALKEVLHDRYIDPKRPWWGVGKLEKIARWVDTSAYASEFIRVFFEQGAQFGGFIETEEETEERIKLIKLGLINEHVGVKNAHKIAVLPKGSKFTAATATMSDMQLKELEEQMRDKILSAFSVPKTLVGLTTEVNRASAEASEYIFAKYTVKPIVDDFIEFLNTQVAPLFGGSEKFYFAYDEFVPENVEAKLKEREIALNKQPYMTVNEVRATVGLPPVKGGDTVYGNPLQTPLGTPPAALDGGGDDEEDKEPKKAIPPRLRHSERKGRMIEGIMKAAEIAAQHHDPDATAHKHFVSRVDAHEKLLADKVRDFNNRQEREVLQNLTRVGKAVTKGDVFEMEREIDILVDFVTPLLKGLAIEQAVEEYAAQGYLGAFSTDDSAVTKIVELASKRLAKSYNNTTANLLKSALNDGIQNGEDFTQLAERVKQVYSYSDQVRAGMVARTESFYVANKGSLEAYRQSGVVTAMRWYTAEDEMVCEFCGPQNGKIIGLSEAFFKKGETVTGRDGGTLDLTYRTIDVPPLHTNCRCFIRPETIEVKGVELPVA